RANAECGAKVDAELLGDIALHLGHGDLQHDLLAAGDVENIGDIVGSTSELHGNGLGTVPIIAGQHVASEYDAVGTTAQGDRFNPDVGTGNDAGQSQFQRSADLGGLLDHLDVEHGDGAPLIVEEENVGVAAQDALQDGARAGAHHRRGNAGLGH